MLTQYIKAAMALAAYELVDGKWVGEIQALPGVWTFASAKGDCRKDLQGALEEWIILKLKGGDKLPILGGVDLNLTEEYVEIG